MGNRFLELIEALKEAKEALMNRDPQTRANECYNHKVQDCKCTLCVINKALADKQTFLTN